jgi:hypothetical protein
MNEHICIGSIWAVAWIHGADAVELWKIHWVHVGLFLVLVTMATLAYATITFHLRHRWVIHLRLDVWYYGRLGPTILSLALFLAYAINVARKLG